MQVTGPGGEPAGKVLDVRLLPRPGRFEFGHLVIGPGHPGSMLGYDRGDFNGPWLVEKIVGRLHRKVGLLRWDAVESVDWDGDGGVRVRERPRLLRDLD